MECAVAISGIARGINMGSSAPIAYIIALFMSMFTYSSGAKPIMQLLNLSSMIIINVCTVTTKITGSNTYQAVVCLTALLGLCTHPYSHRDNLNHAPNTQTTQRCHWLLSCLPQLLLFHHVLYRVFDLFIIIMIHCLLFMLLYCEFVHPNT